ncbi:hypothetical protein EDB83DRAFT_2339380, partial [Lactarius deliciosus]
CVRALSHGELLQRRLLICSLQKYLPSSGPAFPFLTARTRDFSLVTPTTSQSKQFSYIDMEQPDLKTSSVVTSKRRMPKKTSASNTSASGASSGPKTNYELTKPYGGMHGFMRSYGLKTWDNDDVQEAKAILDGFRKVDAAAAEEDKANSK